MPVVGWQPAMRNPEEANVVLRAMRQFEEQSMLLLQQLSMGLITQEEYSDSLTALFMQSSLNAYTAGRRGIGNLTRITPEEVDVLEDAIEDDIFSLAALTGKGAIGTDEKTTITDLIVSMILDPTNYLGSGLPGDPMAEWPPPFGAGKPKPTALARAAASNLPGGPWAQQQLRDYQNRMSQYASSIRGQQFRGEIDGLNQFVHPDAQLVWWTLGPADHCGDCLRLSDMSPFYGSALNGIYPGSGHTRCGSRCQCYLDYDLPSTICSDPFSGEGLADFGIHGEYGETSLIESNGGLSGLAGRGAPAALGHEP